MSKGNKGYFELRSDEAMIFLYNKIGQFLNACETEEAMKTIQKYRQIAQVSSRYSELDYGVEWK